MSRRVVVTGLGMVTPLGHDVESTWEAIKAGQSGIDRITRYNASDHLVQIAAEVKDWDPTNYVPAKDVRRRDRYQLFSFAAYKQAVQQAGLELNEEQLMRTGVFVGSAVGGVESFHEQAILVHETDDLRKVTPFGVSRLVSNGGST